MRGLFACSVWTCSSPVACGLCEHANGRERYTGSVLRKHARMVVLFFLFGWWLSVSQTAMAQDTGDPVPRNEEAEAVFEQALLAFDEEDYETAYRRFRLVYEAYPLHRKTTAATLMAGKALYRDGEYQRAIDLLSAFLQLYPTSSYLDEAEHTLRFAQQHVQDEARRDGAVRLGIALPLSRNDVELTQSLFNGIRLAIDEYNRAAEQPIRMVFRDSRGTASGARRAIAALVAEDVDAIIGPLYSEEAQAAAQAAERAQVVLIAPLATDETVAQGRQYIFQANPTITSRGAVMARLAVNDLQLLNLGIVAESGNSISERMAEGFQEEALRLGVNVAFYEMLPDARSWGQLYELIGKDRLSSIDAMYLPLSGRNTQRHIEEALASLGRAGSVLRVLGNSGWRNAVSRQQASAFSVTYTDDFYVDDADPNVQAFKRAYRALAGQRPDRLAYVGYDVVRFLQSYLTRPMDLPLHERLHETDFFQGLGTQIRFNSGHANETMFFLQYRNEDIVRLR